MFCHEWIRVSQGNNSTWFYLPCYCLNSLLPRVLLLGVICSFYCLKAQVQDKQWTTKCMRKTNNNKVNKISFLTIHKMKFPETVIVSQGIAELDPRPDPIHKNVGYHKTFLHIHSLQLYNSTFASRQLMKWAQRFKQFFWKSCLVSCWCVGLYSCAVSHNKLLQEGNNIRKLAPKVNWALLRRHLIENCGKRRVLDTSIKMTMKRSFHRKYRLNNIEGCTHDMGGRWKIHRPKGVLQLCFHNFD